MISSALTEKLPSSAQLEDYRGVQTVGSYTDVKAEFAALTSGCGLFDLGWRAKIVLTGSDRVRWMNGMVTNNVRDLQVGRGVYAFLLNPQGKIQGDLYVHNRGEYLLVDTDQEQAKKILEIFDHYIIMDDVEVANSSEKLTAMGIAGPASRGVLEGASFAIPDLEPLQSADMVWHQIGLTILRSDNPAVESYEVWLSPEHVGTIWEALLKSGATAVGSQAFELFRVASGVPRYGVDIRERDLPQETEQARALNFNKGCYVGQEIVERIRSRGAVHRMFTGFRLTGAAAMTGSKLRSEGKDVGEVTSVAVLPSNDRETAVALGYVRREAAAVGKAFDVETSQATVADIPFEEIFSS
jgi:folate-binding protein YgfZ